jgi:hypothetical protein
MFDCIRVPPFVVVDMDLTNLWCPRSLAVSVQSGRQMEAHKYSCSNPAGVGGWYRMHPLSSHLSDTDLFSHMLIGLFCFLVDFVPSWTCQTRNAGSA